MNIVLFLIGIPLVSALLLSSISNQIVRGMVVRVGALVIAAASVYLAYLYIGKEAAFFTIEYPWLEHGIFWAEIAVAAFLLFNCRSIIKSEFWIPALIVAQAGISIYCEYGCAKPVVEHNLYIDNFSMIMALIIGIIGSLIAVYAVGYMHDYHHHNPGMKDRRRSFFFVTFLFLSAMFGVIFANNIVWLFLCWEVTTVCSFIMIGYPKTPEATRNAYRALGMNMIGGLGFAIAILYCMKAPGVQTIELDHLIKGGAAVALIPAVLISFAGLTKSAQMPFSSWLLGAMVAPTPVSALLHSSTMVKAGVFIIIKFAPVLQGTTAGFLVALVGGITFLMTSLMAITQSNAKRVLAYSTIANLGLIVACAGVGTYETVWAAILLVIFHAISKALLFLGVGTIEHKIGSRDIEDMEGLIATRPMLGLVMLIGIVGMFLAPFGMLISKWATLKAFVDNNLTLAVIVAYGSAPTLFFWAKWMGKLVSVPAVVKKIEGKINRDEWTALGILAFLTIAACALFPLAANLAIDPYVQALYGKTLMLSQGVVALMIIMLGLIILLPLSVFYYRGRTKPVTAYLAGANLDGSASFMGSLGTAQLVGTRNYYLSTFMSEKKLFMVSVILSLSLIIALFTVVSL
jgi:ech hydrogenase subunit A